MMLYAPAYRLDHQRVIQPAPGGVIGFMQTAVAASWTNPPPPPIVLLDRRTDVRVGGRFMSDQVDGGADPADLVAAIAARQDRAAFAELFEMYAGRIKAWLMRGGATAETAEEVAQETLITVWRKAATYDRGRAAVGAWIFTIARNARIDRLRRDQRARRHLLYEHVEPEGPEPPDTLLDSSEREQRVRAALAELPEDQVAVVQLSFFEGRAHGDIAEHLEIPLGTVKSRLRLAMKRLRTFLGDLQ